MLTNSSGALRFSGKSVVVTGGATGVGYETVRRFAREGASVLFIGRRKEAGEAAVAQLREEGLPAVFMQGDVAAETDVEAAAKAAAETHGGIDIWVNNAAAFEPVPFLHADRAKWKRIFDIIVDGAWFGSQYAARCMTEQGRGGSIINISSINAYRALDQSSHYNAAKGALDQLTRNLAYELIDYGIRVNGLNLGFIDTPMSVVDGVNELETDWFRTIYQKNKKLPMKRAAHPAEVAAAVAFLASEDASYICGATIPVDGGLSITF